MSEKQGGITVNEWIQLLQEAVKDGHGEAIVCLPGEIDEESGMCECVPVMKMEAVEDDDGEIIIVLDCEAPMQFEVSKGMFEN